MGLLSRKAHTSPGSTTAAITPTFSQTMPEKLPWDQWCRLTILASSAKVTTKSVMDEQI